jgi:hypothetical protein
MPMARPAPRAPIDRVLWPCVTVHPNHHAIRTIVSGGVPLVPLAAARVTSH